MSARAAVFFNAGYEFSEDMNFYSFGSMGRKEASSLQTYRRPSQDGGVDVNKDGDRNDLTACRRAGIPGQQVRIRFHAETGV
jgi:hypothetical protein